LGSGPFHNGEKKTSCNMYFLEVNKTGISFSNTSRVRVTKKLQNMEIVTLLAQVVFLFTILTIFALTTPEEFEWRNF
jgi:hypothetical protein